METKLTETTSHRGGVSAFGETKKIVEWSKDPRCAVSAQTIVNRLHDGWESEKAISEPARTFAIVEAFGEAKTLPEWAKDPRCLVSRRTLAKRLARGMAAEEAMCSETEMHLTALGETKTVKAWELDPRCQVSATTLRWRTQNNWDAESAITKPTKVNASREQKAVTCFGETKTLVEWSKDKRCTVSLNALYKRVRNGWDLETALTTPNKTVTTVTAFGETKTVAQWAEDKRCTVPLKTLRKRLQRLPPEDAITNPSTELWAFGECKSLEGWATDSRCQVSRRTLSRRLETGMALEDAITTPPKGNIYTAFGESKTISEWAKDSRCVVSRGTLSQRLMVFGWEPETAITIEATPGRPAREVAPGWTLKQLSDLHSINRSTINSRILRGMDVEEAASTQVPALSQGELELQSLFTEWGVTFVANDRTTIAPKEIDILLPEQNLGIEFNGLYWHSELYCAKNYHAEKVKAAKAVGVQLIQIWEDDWLYRRPQVERMLVRKLGVSRERLLNARDCAVIKVTPLESQQFLNENHIQGSTNSSIRLALQTKDGEVVAVAAFQKRKNSGKEYYELVRFATSCIVRGGFSKLVAHFRRSPPEMDLVSFANLEISDGSLYESNGWTLDKVLKPDYMYVVNGRREHKFNYRKGRFRKDPNLKFEEGMTERELAVLNGLYRVYDSGKLRYVLQADS